MTYSLSVINRAARALGEPPVDTLEDQDLWPGYVRKIIGAGRNYDATVGSVLKAIGRGEFIARCTLSPLAADGDWAFPYRYQLPQDGLAWVAPAPGLGLEVGIERVGDADQEVLRATETGEMELTYIRRFDLELASREVIDAIGLALAAQCAYQVTSSRQHTANVEDKAAKAIPLAREALPKSTDDVPRRTYRMARVRGARR